MGKTPLTYCGEQVRKYDPDRFLISMFFAPEQREALWALFAFNHEIAKTREVVSETQLGLIRLQWWRDAISRFYDEGVVLQHEVLEPLCEAIKRYDLPLEHFETLLYAREFDLEDVLPTNMEGLLNYIDFTTSPLLKLAVQVTGGQGDQEPVQSAAINQGLTGILRAVPFHAVQRRCYLPQSLVGEFDLKLGDLYEGREVPALKDIVMACLKEYVSDVQADSRFLRLCVSLGDMYRAKIAACGGDVRDSRMRVPPKFMAFRLFLRSLV